MRRLLAIGIVAALAADSARACETAEDAARPHIERAADGRGVHISYRAVLQAPLASIDQMLSDPASFSTWLPGVHDAAPTADGFVAVYRLPWPLGRVEEVMHVERLADADGGVSFTWRRISGDFRRDDACWRLRALSPTSTEVTYSAELQLHRWVPGYLVRRAERIALLRAARNLERCALDLP